MLVDRFYIAPSMLHCVGADAMSMFAVFSNGEHGAGEGMTSERRCG